MGGGGGGRGRDLHIGFLGSILCSRLRMAKKNPVQ